MTEVTQAARKGRSRGGQAPGRADIDGFCLASENLTRMHNKLYEDGTPMAFSIAGLHRQHISECGPDSDHSRGVSIRSTLGFKTGAKLGSACA